MSRWKIRQTIDLARSGSGPQVWPDALMVAGDKEAHSWEITIRKGSKPVSLDGATVAAYFNRADDVAVRVPGTAAGSVATVTLKQECYAIEGPLVGIFRVTLDGATMTASVLRFVVGKGPCDAIVDPGNVVPNLDDLLAQIERMEAGTAAANTATANANTAAANANSKAAAANTAAGRANTAADRLSGVDLEVTMLPPSSDPTAEVTQTATQTTFKLGIPTSNLAYATFEVETESMELLMHSPDGFDDISFSLNNGVLEVSV